MHRLFGAGPGIDPLRSFVAAFETSPLTIGDILWRRVIQATTDMLVGSVQGREEDQIAATGSGEPNRSDDERFTPPLHPEPLKRDTWCGQQTQAIHVGESNPPVADVPQLLLSDACLHWWWTMPLDRRTALASAILIVSLNSASAEQPKRIDRLGCWETERRTVDRQGNVYSAFCFLKDRRLYGVSLHGTSGHDYEMTWRRLDRGHIEIDGQTCVIDRSTDGTTLHIADCPNFARVWRKAAARTVMP